MKISLHINSGISVFCFSLPRDYNTCRCYIKTLEILATVASVTEQASLSLIRSEIPKDRFSCDVAHILLQLQLAI